MSLSLGTPCPFPSLFLPVKAGMGRRYNVNRLGQHAQHLSSDMIRTRSRGICRTLKTCSLTTPPPGAPRPLRVPPHPRGAQSPALQRGARGRGQDRALSPATCERLRTCLGLENWLIRVTFQESSKVRKSLCQHKGRGLGATEGPREGWGCLPGARPLGDQACRGPWLV